MKKTFSFLLTLIMGVAGAQQLNAQIAFSMDEEKANQNTPEGWKPVELPQGLPEFTAANTFDITAAPFNASTSSEDNTAAIQAALDAAANAGGGMVVIPKGTFLSNCLQMGSKTVLHLCKGATLKMKAFDTFPVDENGYRMMESPFITGKKDASDIVIEGEGRASSVIDGQGGPWWDQVEEAKAVKKSTKRSAMIRFWQGSRYLFRNFCVQNAPNTNITIGRNGKGGQATAHGINIKNPASTAADPSHNTDGFPIWSQYVNIYDCDIDTGDDNVVCDNDAQYVHVWNCRLKAGHGASLGSFTKNMHDIIYENLTLDGTDCGFRLKSNRDRSGDVYNIIFRNSTMTNVPSPFVITSWYDKIPESPVSVMLSPDELIETTPRFHDVLIQNVQVSGHTSYKSSAKNNFGIFIYGRPESKIKDITFDNVQITHSKGIKMNFCEGITFLKNCSYEVKNTNKTAKNGYATKKKLDDVIEEKIDASFVWGK
jgi:polygalacturonase